MTRRLRLAAAALLILTGVLTPAASGADPGGNSGDATSATAKCTKGYTYNSGSGDCEKHETRPAGKSCPPTIGGHAVRMSGDGCATVTAHTTRPTYTCDTANAGNPAVRYALAGDPPYCGRTVTRQVSEQRTVTDMVHYTQTYTVRVASTVTERVPYTAKIRIAPFTKRVRVAPFTKTYMGAETYTYTVRVRYCTKWAVVVGQSVCVKHGYRNEQRTGVRETLITEPAYHYENQPVYNYRTETRYRTVTRTVWRTETRTRLACCKPVTSTITVTRTVRDPQTAVPDATCPTAGYSLNASSRCERPAGTRLGGVAYRCATGWSAATGDPANCERTLTRDPAWACATGSTTDRSTTPPHCHPAPGEEEEADDDDDPPECTTALSTLSAGTVTRSGAWAAGCASVHKSTDQVPYWAWRYTFTLVAAAALDLDATSAGDPHVYITDSDGTVVGSDDDSGADGRDSRIRGLKLPAGAYTVEVTTGSERSTGSFALTLKLTATAGAVTISGFKAAEGTPAVGKTAVKIVSGFTVSPAGATCKAKPAGAAVSPSSGTQRTVSLSVAAATTVTVALTCTSGANSGTAKAMLKANPAPVRISGLADALASVGDADSATVSSAFEVTPASASCTATPTGAKVAPATGAKRTVSLAVAKGKTVTVTVTCSHNGASHAVRAKLTATRVGGCTGKLGSFGSAGVTVRGTLGAKGDCTSAFLGAITGGTHWARRHVLVLAHPGWVTITLRSAPTNTSRLDTYLLILKGDRADGTGTYVAHNDDQGSGHATSQTDSRIARRFLPAGTYTIEATTYRWHERHGQRAAGNYILHITTDHTPVPRSQPTRLRVRNGTTVTSTWAYQPPTAAVSAGSSFPDGITASLSAAGGTAKLTAKPSKVGQYAVAVTYANGPETVTKSTTIDSYCPTGQIGVLGDCLQPLKPLEHEHHSNVVPQPKGYGPPDGTNSCIKDITTDGTIWYTCRRTTEDRRFISKNDPQIAGTSGRVIVNGEDHGVTLVLKSGEILETCQTPTSTYWQCDYRADKFWQKAVVKATFSNYIYPALHRGVIVPSRCALSIVALRVIGRGNPQAYAATVNTCSAVADPVTP